MRGERFDDFSRWAVSRPASATRRSFLRAIGLGGAAGVLGPVGATASPAVAPSRIRVGAQAEPDAEIDELAFSLDYDIDRIFRFVRDEVVYDPYAGVLRGGKGTLWGLAGNATDQAVLLKELLDAALVPARFAVGQLAAERASSLLEAGRLDAETVRTRASRSVVAPPVADEQGQALTPEEQAFLDAFPAFAERVMETIDRHTDNGIATVTEALAGAGITLPAPTAGLPDEERRRHVWVQYASGTDWIDLDPSMPDAEPGDVFAADPTPLDAIPDDLMHRVSFRLVAEQVAGDAVARNELLSFEAPSSELLGVPISLIHPQPAALEQIGVAVGGLLEGFRNFAPALLVGEETVFGTPVTFGTDGGVLDVFGEGPVNGDTLAEWLEVTVTTPEGARTATRTIFDRVSAEARAAGPVDPSAVAPVELVDTGDAEDDFLPLTGLWAFSVVAGNVPSRQALSAVPEELEIDDILPPLLAYHYAWAYRAANLPTLAGARLYHDEPNVTAFVLKPTEASADSDSARIGIDLLQRSARVATSGSVETVHPLVAAGVLGHAVEASMFELGGQEPLNLPITANTGVLQVFAEATAQGIAIAVLQPGTTPTAMPELAAGAQAMVESALADGQIVIVPERPVELGGQVRSGWWIVDPATGATWDQMDDGGGSTMSEFAFFVIKIASCAIAFATMGANIGIAIDMVAIGVTPGKAAAHGVLGAGAAATGAAFCGG